MNKRQQQQQRQRRDGLEGEDGTHTEARASRGGDARLSHAESERTSLGSEVTSLANEGESAFTLEAMSKIGQC